GRRDGGVVGLALPVGDRDQGRLDVFQQGLVFRVGQEREQRRGGPAGAADGEQAGGGSGEFGRVLVERLEAPPRQGGGFGVHVRGGAAQLRQRRRADGDQLAARLLAVGGVGGV